MGYLLTSMLLYLLLAALIGGIIGWYLKSIFCDRDCEAKLNEWKLRVKSLEDQNASLNAGGSVSGKASAGASADTEALRANISGLEETNRLQADRIADLEGKLASGAEAGAVDADLRGRVDGLEADLEASRSRAADLEAQLGSAKSANSGLESKLAAAATGAAAATAATRAAGSGDDAAMKAKVSGLEADLKAANKSKADLEAKLRASGSADADLDEKLKKARADLSTCKTNVKDRDARIADLEAQLKKGSGSGSSGKKEKFTTDAPAPKNLMKSPPAKKDNLQEIWGVGPVMQGVLNKLGIYTFKQVSELSSRDVEWVSANIGTFPDRIERDKWVSQAGKLHKKHHG